MTVDEAPLTKDEINRVQQDDFCSKREQYSVDQIKKFGEFTNASTTKWYASDGSLLGFVIHRPLDVIQLYDEVYGAKKRPDHMADDQFTVRLGDVDTGKKGRAGEILFVCTRQTPEKPKVFGWTVMETYLLENHYQKKDGYCGLVLEATKTSMVGWKKFGFKAGVSFTTRSGGYQHLPNHAFAQSTARLAWAQKVL